jgi:Disulfide bond formation protein DsbB
VPDRRVINPSTVSLFYALLAIVANVAVVVIVVAAVTGRVGALADVLGGTALTSAFAVALLATAGSLYFSEVARYEPCTLCWYQRIAMYPLVVILGVAVLRDDTRVRRYVLPIVAIGAVIALYHYALERVPALDSGVCSSAVPCTFIWFQELGFITLPYLALSAFLLIGALAWLAGRADESSEVSAA